MHKVILGASPPDWGYEVCPVCNTSLNSSILICTCYQPPETALLVLKICNIHSMEVERCPYLTVILSLSAADWA